MLESLATRIECLRYDTYESQVNHTRDDSNSGIKRCSHGEGPMKSKETIGKQEVVAKNSTTEGTNARSKISWKNSIR